MKRYRVDITLWGTIEIEDNENLTDEEVVDKFLSDAEFHRFKFRRLAHVELADEQDHRMKKLLEVKDEKAISDQL